MLFEVNLKGIDVAKKGNPYLWPYTQKERADARKSLNNLKGDDMTNTKATPRPWNYTGTKDWATVYSVKNHEHVAGIMTKDNKKANAELIVRAVNSFDSFVGACSWVLELIDSGELSLTSRSVELESITEPIKQALALAKGQ